MDNYKNSIRVCWYCFLGIAVAILLSFLFSGCKTMKVVENTDTKDSVRTEYIEKIVKDTVTVTIEVPAEAKERLTNDTISNLATSFARSTATMTWKGGIPWLFHSLENIPQQIEKPVEVETKEVYKTLYRTRYVSKTKTVTKDLPWYKKAFMWAGYVETFIIVLVLLGCLVIGKRK